MDEKINNEALKMLAENERHFHTIQAGIRGLASTWTLASFGAMAFLLNHNNIKYLILNSVIIIVFIIFIFNLSITVLWTIDQNIYQRLFNTNYIAGLRLEQQYPSIPPVRAIQAITTRGKSISSWIKFFYISPVFAFGTLAVIIALRESFFLQNSSLENNYLKSLIITTSLISLMPGFWLLHQARFVSFFRMVQDLPDEYSKILSRANCLSIIENHLKSLPTNK